MSSLQKFHRRTQSSVVAGPATWPPTSIGMGDATHGYWMANRLTQKIIVAPQSTEITSSWGAGGVSRGTLNTTDGLANTNTLYSFGSAAYPAYYCHNLSTGGYNTWYWPSRLELQSVISNAPSCANASLFTNGVTTYWSSTEIHATKAYYVFNTGQILFGGTYGTKNPVNGIRAIRLY